MTNKNQSAILRFREKFQHFGECKRTDVEAFLSKELAQAEARGREEGYAEGWRDAEEIGIQQVRIAEEKTKPYEK